MEKSRGRNYASGIRDLGSGTMLKKFNFNFTIQDLLQAFDPHPKNECNTEVIQKSAKNCFSSDNNKIATSIYSELSQSIPVYFQDAIHNSKDNLPPQLVRQPLPHPSLRGEGEGMANGGEH